MEGLPRDAEAGSESGVVVVGGDVAVAVVVRGVVVVSQATTSLGSGRS